jgi:hypothetical protein
MIAAIVYLLGALTSACCSILLLRGYSHGRSKLLLWSGLCFGGLAISNILVFVDLRILPTVDLYVLRLAVAAVSMLLLVYGLIWEGQ